MNVESAAKTLNEVRYYENGFEHLADELRKLDLIITRRIALFRNEIQQQACAVTNQNIYVSDQEVDWLLQRDVLAAGELPDLTSLDKEIEELDQSITQAVTQSLEQGVVLPLVQLAQLFRLNGFDVEVLIVCLAPELRRKYDRLYAYLQDDISRKRPSVDLILDLLCEDELQRWQYRQSLSHQATLLRVGLLGVVDDVHSPSGSSGLSVFLKLNPRILSYLLGVNALEEGLQDVLNAETANFVLNELPLDNTPVSEARQFIQAHIKSETSLHENLMIHFHGPEGVGKKDLALALSAELGGSLLVLDLESLLARGLAAEMVLRHGFLESLLQQTPLCLIQGDVLFSDHKEAQAALHLLPKLVAEFGWLTFFTSTKSYPGPRLVDNVLFRSFELTLPEVPLREKAWRQALGLADLSISSEALSELAQQFRLTPGKIREAVRSVADTYRFESLDEALLNDKLLDACRRQSNQKLAELAMKVGADYAWEDLVLPSERINLLKEVCNQVRQQYKVLYSWGFDHKLAYGKGISALFSGPPGTGKTMAAQVIAADLHMDLYKVDLSSVVSKYIGETEKNLSRIFREAETSNAVLFFDEADALFGKRTEVSDAHDRYANIEVNYLLQKMEDYAGIVILASNFRDNIDDAFIRRIRFIVEFPFPDEASRLHIWQGHFPAQAPLADDIDYGVLAKKLAVAGGNIRNIVVNAAYLASQNNVPIGMEHLLTSAQWEYEKVGKSWRDIRASKTTTGINKTKGAEHVGVQRTS